mmetsp:Transcript_13432/g.20356  ORF Transcript_13432/g.20356 Transcript_13432/m.20356 type:complete len:272 (+) Transcript_13432:332-1147(+)
MDILRKSHLPCTNSSGKRNLNWAIEKSEAFTACCPSRPDIPIPIWASCIIPTSLAPSPIAKVTGSGLMKFLTSLTSNAFCLGLTRQAMTALQLLATENTISSNKGSPRKCSRAAPSTTKARCPSVSRIEDDNAMSAPSIWLNLVSFTCFKRRPCRTSLSTAKMLSYIVRFFLSKLFSVCFPVRKLWIDSISGSIIPLLDSIRSDVARTRESVRLSFCSMSPEARLVSTAALADHILEKTRGSLFWVIFATFSSTVSSTSISGELLDKFLLL